MRENILVSIIVRTYNEEKLIGKLLESIKRQNFNKENLEVIIVDSGSEDSTLQIVQNYEVKLVKIKKENFSFGYSLNRGIEVAKGKYILIISAHCYPRYNNWISNMIKPFEDDKIALVYGRQIGNKFTKYSENRIFYKWFPNSNKGIQRDAFCNNANCAIRRDIWEKQHYDESLSGLEDLDWATKIKKKDFKIYYEPAACIYHLHSETYGQIKNRYEREAIAYKRIYPTEAFGLIDYFKMFISNIFTDFYFAKKENKLFKNFVSIIIFRHCQFFGAFQGFNIKNIDSDLKKKFYYPDKVRNNKEYAPIVELLNKIKNKFQSLSKIINNRNVQ